MSRPRQFLLLWTIQHLCQQTLALPTLEQIRPRNGPDNLISNKEMHHVDSWLSKTVYGHNVASDVKSHSQSDFIERPVLNVAAREQKDGYYGMSTLIDPYSERRLSMTKFPVHNFKEKRVAFNPADGLDALRILNSQKFQNIKSHPGIANYQSLPLNSDSNTIHEHGNEYGPIMNSGKLNRYSESKISDNPLFRFRPINRFDWNQQLPFIDSNPANEVTNQMPFRHLSDRMYKFEDSFIPRRSRGHLSKRKSILFPMKMNQAQNHQFFQRNRHMPSIFPVHRFFDPLQWQLEEKSTLGEQGKVLFLDPMLRFHLFRRNMRPSSHNIFQPNFRKPLPRYLVRANADLQDLPLVPYGMPPQAYSSQHRSWLLPMLRTIQRKPSFDPSSQRPLNLVSHTWIQRGFPVLGPENQHLPSKEFSPYLFENLLTKLQSQMSAVAIPTQPFIPQPRTRQSFPHSPQAFYPLSPLKQPFHPSSSLPQLFLPSHQALSLLLLPQLHVSVTPSPLPHLFYLPPLCEALKY